MCSCIAIAFVTHTLLYPYSYDLYDRRAKAERESRLKAMQAREKKGLLSEEEKVILAEEKAAQAKKKDDCVIQ